MIAHYLQHVPFEGLGSIEYWLKKNNYKITKTCLFEKSAKLPTAKDIDFLIVLGGPMSVNDEKEFGWLLEEKKLIREYISLEKPVLGICLGAQLIANAMGAKVYKNKIKEIGWHKIEGIHYSNTLSFKFPDSIEVFHWHGETFDLPNNSIHIARNNACENQAFQIGKSVIGLQFHLESTPSSVKDIIYNCNNEIIPSEHIQTENKILAQKTENYESINKLMENILTYLIQSINFKK